MIFDISDANFRDILNKEKFYLPIRWDGANFSMTLEKLFDSYIKELEIYADNPNIYRNGIRIDMKKIKGVCGLLVKSVNYYLNGFPCKAYLTFEKAMNLLMQQPLRIYQKSVMEQFDDGKDLKLFRAVSVGDNKPYKRTRAFHTPYNLRCKVSTNRYSIAGYPSLYLGTSLALCCEEIHMNPHQDFVLASVFKLERSIEYTNTNVRVIELGVKPQDFVDRQNEGARRISFHLLEDDSVKETYLLWYPLIAASSYIRVCKSDPFAAEYIIPQLLMQWVRSEIGKNKGDDYDQLIGIRYFSCASNKASDMGFNYVFPTSSQQKSAELPYCSVLARAFRLSEPTYIHEYKDIQSCERYLVRTTDFGYIE